ncbi:hypothetical protein EW146_g9838 [Bondarzewia mesenterica]|uniref:Uncharacterized protein n=1 Tax=Bondarzewia mesenterica TaxID=1095465 RepID=A0A4S4L312_9AGAM|nr:hypothetical protein EW146_g9838 [Bondarzewia mesenterica]
MPPTRPQDDSKSSKTRKCQHCGKLFNVQGVVTHERACARRKAEVERDRAFEERYTMNQKAPLHGAPSAHKEDGRMSLRPPDPTAEGPSVIKTMTAVEATMTVEATTADKMTAAPGEALAAVEMTAAPGEALFMPDDDYNEPLPSTSTTHHPSTMSANVQFPQLDDIKTEYHPSSGKATRTQSFDTYGLPDPDVIQLPHARVREPWRPFRTRLDFDVANFALRNALNKDETNALISLLKRGQGASESMTLKSHAEMYEILDGASHILTPYEQTKISVPYKSESRNFDFHMKPLWEWALDLAGDPGLSPHFVWDAERISKYNGTEFSKLPPNAKPFCFILYADKTKLSSFGGQKGYPIIARCANLPVGIRNSDGLGGGRVVGWLPIVEEDPAETDYEEQCVMALIRGLGGKCPCPICLVPKEQQIELSIRYPLRTASDTHVILAQANDARLAEDKEKILKAHGLRPVKVKAALHQSYILMFIVHYHGIVFMLIILAFLAIIYGHKSSSKLWLLDDLLKIKLSSELNKSPVGKISITSLVL